MVKTLRSSGSDTYVMECIPRFIMAQMMAWASIRKHGQVTINALYQDFLQLHNLAVFDRQDAAKLTKEQKQSALQAMSMIKEKRCGKIKRQTVADGRSQQSLYSKEERVLHTVFTSALMLLIMINAKEGRDVATVDVAGVYLHADLDKFTLLKVEGVLVNIMCAVSKIYIPFVAYKKGKNVLYLKL